MVNFNIFTVCVYFIIAVKVYDCRTEAYRNRCPPLRLNNGRVRLRSSGRVARVSCNWPYMLIQGNELVTCVMGEWSEYPICASSGCDTSLPPIANGRLIISYNGAKIEVECDSGFTVDGPSFIYCNQHLEWNENIIGCKQLKEVYLHCNFESSDDRFCGWQNDNFNDVDWLADKTSSLFFSTRRHVAPGSSQYFTNNYISLDAGNYGSSTSGRLISPILGPVTNKQRCLIFSYKVTEGSSRGKPNLTVSFGGIPHWSTSKGEGKVIIGLYKLNFNSKIVIEGKSCKVAIDNLIITEGSSCTQKPYEEGLDTCTDNCGIISDENNCSCDWECQSNNNCCPDIKQQCPYIKPSDQITKLYLTTTVMPLKITTSVYINSYNNMTINNMTISSKSSNESSFFLTTPTNEQNSTETLMVTSMYTTPTSITAIPTSNITYPTFPPTPPTISTIKPITVTINIPSSTSVSTEIPNTNVSLNFNNTSTSFHLKTLNTLNVNSVHVMSSTTTSIENTSTIAPKFSNSPNLTAYSVMTNTTPILINIPSSTVKIPITNKFISIAKNISNTIGKVSKENTTPTSPTLINTDKPVQHNSWSSIINSYISHNKSLLNEHSSGTSFVYTLNSTVSSLVANTTNPTEKFFNPTTELTSPIKYNTTTNIFKLSNFTKFITKTPYIQKITRKSITTENKSFTSKLSEVDNFSKSTPVFNKKFIFFDSYNHTNPRISHLKYDTILNNKSSIDTPNETYYIIQNVTTQPSIRINFIFNTSQKTVNPTTTQISHTKPELNYTFHNQHVQNVDTWLAEHVKQNDNVKNYSFAFDTVTVIKYIIAIGIIFITLKYTFSFITWYFKKSATNDEMNTFFVSSDNDGSCNMELTPNLNVE